MNDNIDIVAHLVPFSFFGDLVADFTMSTDLRALWGGVKSDGWGQKKANWAKLKPYQKRSLESSIGPPHVTDPSKRRRLSPPRTRNVPYREWGSGLLVWDTDSCWWHYDPIDCPEFPDVLDEDVYHYLHVFDLRERRNRVLCAPDIDLYRWAIVTACERALLGPEE